MRVGGSSGEVSLEWKCLEHQHKKWKEKNEPVKETKREQKKDHLESMVPWKAGQEQICIKCYREWSETCFKPMNELSKEWLALAWSEPFQWNSWSGSQTEVNLGLPRSVEGLWGKLRGWQESCGFPEKACPGQRKSKCKEPEMTTFINACSVLDTADFTGDT